MSTSSLAAARLSAARAFALVSAFLWQERGLGGKLQRELRELQDEGAMSDAATKRRAAAAVKALQFFRDPQTMPTWDAAAVGHALVFVERWRQIDVDGESVDVTSVLSKLMIEVGAGDGLVEALWHAAEYRLVGDALFEPLEGLENESATRSAEIATGARELIGDADREAMDDAVKVWATRGGLQQRWAVLSLGAPSALIAKLLADEPTTTAWLDAHAVERLDPRTFATWSQTSHARNAKLEPETHDRLITRFGGVALDYLERCVLAEEYYSKRVARLVALLAPHAHERAAMSTLLALHLRYAGVHANAENAKATLEAAVRKNLALAKSVVAKRKDLPALWQVELAPLLAGKPSLTFEAMLEERLTPIRATLQRAFRRNPIPRELEALCEAETSHLVAGTPSPLLHLDELSLQLDPDEERGQIVDLLQNTHPGVVALFEATVWVMANVEFIFAYLYSAEGLLFFRYDSEATIQIVGTSIFDGIWTHILEREEDHPEDAAAAKAYVLDIVARHGLEWSIPKRPPATTKRAKAQTKVLDDMITAAILVR